MSDMESQKTMRDFVSKNPDLDIAPEQVGVVCGVECGPGSMRGMEDY